MIKILSGHMSYGSTSSLNKIGIKFSDNDFGHSIRGFLKLFVDSAIVDVEQQITKERIVELFNSTISGIYWICQNGYLYNTDEGFHDLRDRWLHIELRHVYLGQEVLDFIKENDNWYNSEFHYVDLERKEVYSV